MSIINRLFGGDKEMAAKVAEFIRQELAAHEAELVAGTPAITGLDEGAEVDPDTIPDESLLQARAADAEFRARHEAARHQTIRI